MDAAGAIRGALYQLCAFYRAMPKNQTSIKPFKVTPLQPCWDFTNRVPTEHFSEYFQQTATAPLHRALGGTIVVASALFASLVQLLVVPLRATGVTHHLGILLCLLL